MPATIDDPAILDEIVSGGLCDSPVVIHSPKGSSHA
jgi:hypothetical protein